MSDSLPIAVTGCSGRMGQMLIQAIDGHPACHLSGVTERPGHDWIGKDLGSVMGSAARGINVADDPLEVFAKTRAVVDFTSPAATVAHAEIAAQARLVHVIGTTGFDQAHLDAISRAAAHAVVIRAGNMSLGVNLLTVLTRQVAKALDEDFDIEIVEWHHNQKVDAPSGTALMLGEAAAEGRAVALADTADRGRDGITGVRERGHIGFAALRGGDVVGEHEVVFAGAGERIKLSHIATDRMLFARGALKAVLWGKDQKPGEYSMLDVLGLAT
jgi:4-hydroxy-tetrahydrodipicolinate reductase